MLQVLRQRLIFGRNITEQMWFANTEMNHKRLEQVAIKCLTLLNLLNMLPRRNCVYRYFKEQLFKTYWNKTRDTSVAEHYVSTPPFLDFLKNFLEQLLCRTTIIW